MITSAEAVCKQEADWIHDTEAEFVGQAFGNVLPRSGLRVCLHGQLPRQRFHFKKDLSEERTREQFSSAILLVPPQKGWWECGRG